MSDVSTRQAIVERETNETRIRLALSLDGEGKSQVHTGIGFFDHMLTHIAFHGKLDLEIEAEGDLHVDEHHTIEDVGICFGKALMEALGDKRGIARYGWCALPMDDALVLTSLDFSGRTFLNYEMRFDRERVGEMALELVEEFFWSVCRACPMTLHLKPLAGHNAHHLVEAAFKSFGKSLYQATRLEGDRLPSTKGILE